ncbi:MAG: hypothetical protein ACK4TA_21590 [Saprospiraceae bacterium]
MKRLLLILFLGLGCTFITLAQQNQTTNRDTSNTATRNYEQMLTAELRMDFRNYALTQLNMTPAEIEAFDPIYREYMNEKDRIVQRKFTVLQKFSDKMKQADSQEDRSEELGDAIEDYWEAEIAETQLQKNYFDRLEDKIDPFKAFQFFMMEDAAHTRLHELRVVEVVPMIREIERIPARNFGSNIQGDTTNNMMQGDTMNMIRNNINNMYKTTPRTNDMNRDTMSNMNRNNMNTQDQNTTRTDDMNRDTMGNINRNNMNTQDQNTTRTDDMNRDTTTTTTTPRTNTTTDNQMNNTTNRGTTTTTASSTTITDYSNWYTSEGTSIGTAGADLSHQDIYNGITRLMSAIESISTATDITITDMRSKRIRIMALLNDLQRNRLTDRHSDEARQILTTLATMISTLQNRTDAGEESAREAMSAAVSIDTNQLLINQLDKVNTFFRHAQTAVNEMSQGVQWTDDNRD